MNEQIKEMAKELSDDYCEQYDDGQGRWCDRECEVCRAERLYNAGYRKTVWHKVSEGDLPVFGKTVIAYDGFDTFVAYKDCQQEWYYAASDTPCCGVVAWTELPEYEGVNND